MDRVPVKPELLRWALRRSRLDPARLREKFPKLEQWERGEVQPTLRQLEDFARATHAPVGYFFLSEPPIERLPIPDFRTVGSGQVAQPSPDLLETIYLCQQRQEWYRDFARAVGQAPLPFVGSSRLSDDVVTTAARLRQALGFRVEERRGLPTWTEALRLFIEQADDLGVLVMVSGVVRSNTHRKLDPEEFRGFALADDLAPLVFVNGADTKAAQMFTLAHELAHLWLGRSGISDAQPAWVSDHRVESWCNRVAAELLVPLKSLSQEYRPDQPLEKETKRLARSFKVSTLVVLRRIHDADGITREELWRAYREELARLLARPKGDGGNFYNTLPVRVGRRFAEAMVVSALEGRTLYRDAFRMLGFSKLSTFHELSHRLGVA